MSQVRVVAIMGLHPELAASPDPDRFELPA